MRSSDVAYREAIRSAYAAAQAPGRWPPALEAIAAYVGGSGAMLVCHDVGRNAHWLIGGGLDAGLGRVYLDRYLDNVFVREITRRGPGLYAAHELTDLATQRRTAFLADIWVPQKIETMLQMAHPAMTTDGASGGFAVTLGARHADNLGGVERRWRRIAPQLRVVIDLYLAVAERQRPAQAQAEMLKLLPEAALLVGAEGAILAANGEAVALLTAGKGLRSRSGGRLATTDETDDGRLRHAVATACGSAAEGSLFRLGQPDRLLVIVTPAPCVGKDERLTAPGRALVRVIDIRVSHQKRAQVAARLFALSEAEVRVLADGARGLSAPAIARQLGVSPSTTRTHLKHIFDKTGVRSQVELAQLVARLPTA